MKILTKISAIGAIALSLMAFTPAKAHAGGWPIAAGVIGGLAVGTVIGATVASAAAPPPYYAYPPVAYSTPVLAQPAPVYVQPAPVYYYPRPVVYPYPVIRGYWRPRYHYHYYRRW